MSSDYEPRHLAPPPADSPAVMRCACGLYALRGLRRCRGCQQEWISGCRGCHGTGRVTVETQFAEDCEDCAKDRHDLQEALGL
jgi:hypothetical protein